MFSLIQYYLIKAQIRYNIGNKWELELFENALTCTYFVFAVSSSKTQFNIETTFLFKENTVCTSLINRHRMLGASLAQGMYNSLAFFLFSPSGQNVK